MSSYTGIYSKDHLIKATEIAWKRKENILIFYPGEKYSNGYIRVGSLQGLKKEYINSANYNINVSAYETMEELDYDIACMVIGG